MQRPLPSFPLHKNTLTRTLTQFELGFHLQTYPHLHMRPHILFLLHTEALMLLRLIISQVYHLIFIWASEVLTSISVFSFAFSLFCHLSAFPFSTLLSSVSHFLLSLSLSLCVSLCLPPSIPDIAEARVLQVVFSVRSNEKLPETRG